jgi:predicted peptidase
LYLKNDYFYIMMLKYLTYLPKGFKEEFNKNWPLIIFLHGVGERGHNVEIVRRNGLPKSLEEGLAIPFIVVAPQCPDNEGWQPERIKKVLDEVLEKYPVDVNRIYLTGLSMGGFGTWKTAIEYRYIFAAISPICGGGFVYDAPKIKHIPIWVFHGAKDDVVPISKSEDMVNALRDLNADIKFTIYPETKHDSWTETYNNLELYDWFLKYSKK